MLNGLLNFLQFLYDNWTVIIVIISLIITIIQKTKSYFSKSNEEKIEIAKAQIHESMLKMITDAEVDYETWSQAGSIKRSQVIQKIFADYPILSKFADQDALIEWIDDAINDSLRTLRKIIAENRTDNQEETMEQN